MKKSWILLVDLDGTLWDSDDISSLKPPFRKVGDYAIEDSQGIVVKAYSEMVELLKWARENGALVAVVSWNIEEVALEALEKMGLLELVDYYAIEFHPRKDLMALKLVSRIAKNGYLDAVKCVVYIDDVEAFLSQVSQALEGVCTIRAWRDFHDKRMLMSKVSDCLSKCSV